MERAFYITALQQSFHWRYLLRCNQIGEQFCGSLGDSAEQIKEKAFW